MLESPYYTSEQATIILQKNVDTVRRLCQKGKIEGARKIGGEWLIPRSSIDPQPAPQPRSSLKEQEP